MVTATSRRLIIEYESDGAAPTVRLTRREWEVLECLCHRLTDAEIAARLCISRRTVGTHVGSILGKLGADNRRDAAAIAVQHGLIWTSFPLRLPKAAPLAPSI